MHFIQFISALIILFCHGVSLNAQLNNTVNLQTEITDMKSKTGNTGRLTEDVIELINCTVSPFSEGFAVVKFKENGPQLMNAQGQIVIKHDHVFTPVFGEYFKNGFLLVSDNVYGKIGIINSNLELVVPCEFSISNTTHINLKSKTDFDFSLNRIILSKKNQKNNIEDYYLVTTTGVIDKINPVDRTTLKTPEHPFSKLGYSYRIEAVCPWKMASSSNSNDYPDFTEFAYSELAPFKIILKEIKPSPDALDKMKNHSLIGFCDVSGRVIIQPRFETIISGFREGYAITSYLSDYGTKLQMHINERGELAYLDEYTFVSPFSKGIAYAEYADGKNTLKAFINVNGEKIGSINPKSKSRTIKVQSKFVSMADDRVYQLSYNERNLAVLEDINSKQMKAREFFTQGQQYFGDFTLSNETNSGMPSDNCVVVKLGFVGPSPIYPIKLHQVGLLNLHTSQILIPPAFTRLSDIDEVSGLAYAEMLTSNGDTIKGFVDQFGVYKFVLVQR